MAQDSAMPNRTNQGALDAFTSRKAEIEALFDLLREASDDHFNIAPDEVHWGHVLCLSSAADRLRDAAVLLNIE
jgi:hypothetical protein